jgi:phosphocarrier protein FPr/phosphocarrier protein
MTTENNEVLKVLAPLSGWCASLDDNPDPVFRGRILGDGVSIDPTEGRVLAPFDAEVLTVPESRHAINLRADNGAEFLIHVGVDTVGMAGSGFEAHVAPGDRVKSGQPLLSFDLEKVLNEAASLKTPVLLLSDGFEIGGPQAMGAILSGEELFEVRSVAAAGPDTASRGDTSGAGTKEIRKIVAVGLEHGIHARPAATLKAAIADLDVSVKCQLGQQVPADARSPVALMSLGITYGDVVTIVATGPDAQQAVDAVVSHLETLDLDEEELAARSKPIVVTAAIKEPVAPPSDGAVIRTQPASPGLAIGMAWALEKWDVPCEEAQGSIDEEKQALARALEAVGGHLQKLSADGAGVGAEIAAAHLALLQDPALIVTATDLIDNRLSASHAWHESINQSVESLLSVNDKRMRERVDDLKDMNLRVQRALTGQDPGQGPELPESSILIAENLLPSQLLELDPVRVAGICTAAGGTTSHVAILAISLEIPMLVAAGDEVLAIANGDRLILDAEFGELTVRPDDNEAALFEQRLKEENSRRQTEQAAAHESCHTSDGVHIHFNANLASPEEAKAAVQAGAEGCGLLRTEFVFMSRARAPGVEQQLEIYQQISDALQDRPMVVRTLDAGGDKPISYIEQPDEENPALGVRGIRLSLDNRAMLETQLEALLRLRRSTPLQVMIPMVTSVNEISEVREIIDAVCQSSDLENTIRLGVMIETPAAALIADRLAGLVDFFSIGTNDLTQYTLSMDRGEPRLASRLDTLHPAVLELIGKTATAANDAGIEVAVCGGAAGDMMIAPILLGLGIRELSMPQSLIARQKARLRELSVGDCISLAQNALAMNSAREVRAMMRNFYGN